MPRSYLKLDRVYGLGFRSPQILADLPKNSKEILDHESHPFSFLWMTLTFLGNFCRLLALATGDSIQTFYTRLSKRTLSKLRLNVGFDKIGVKSIDVQCLIHGEHGSAQPVT